MNEDLCGEYGGEERRKHCELVVALKQQYLDDKKDRDQWRQGIDKKLESVCSFIEKIEGPYHAGLWAVRIMFGAFLLGLTAGIIEYFKRHWN